mmetsp:Transcript_35946/g.40885  ORF Transcript_35946/g.40885 Transcript_35946/m.40885 type:complete len:90 (-) Transcript_35946:241-510(-)
MYLAHGILKLTRFVINDTLNHPVNIRKKNTNLAVFRKFWQIDDGRNLGTRSLEIPCFIVLVKNYLRNAGNTEKEVLDRDRNLGIAFGKN